jgi:hypothetical protein
MDWSCWDETRGQVNIDIVGPSHKSRKVRHVMVSMQISLVRAAVVRGPAPLAPDFQNAIGRLCIRYLNPLLG